MTEERTKHDFETYYPFEEAANWYVADESAMEDEHTKAWKTRWHQHLPLCSIAISLKRIADMMEADRSETVGQAIYNHKAPQ